MGDEKLLFFFTGKSIVLPSQAVDVIGYFQA